jgi:hypothetical protein
LTSKTIYSMQSIKVPVSHILGLSFIIRSFIHSFIHFISIHNCYKSNTWTSHII